MNEKWFLMSIEEIEQKLKTNAVLGLPLKAARSRANLHKKDKKDTIFFSVKKKRIDKILLDLFSDVFLVLLTLLAIFSLFFEGDAIICSGILVIIAINLAISFFIYYRDRRTVESMSDFFAPTARVIRGGKLYIVDYRDLTEGDVIMIEKGDILGCDARLVQSNALRVCMKIDKKTEKTLDKYAGASVRADELYAENMINMVHAGSTVLEGSGRAIVTAIGQYTYLGAMTGGITELPSRELPNGLAHLKKECSKLGLIMLLMTLPFCIFSVMFGSFPSGNVVLSEAVLVALALGATAMLSRSSNLFINFYVRFIRKLAISENPCIIRSIDALDKLTDVDYLFLIDGSIATDGILHFDTLITADGEAKKNDRMGMSATALSEMIVIYSQARSAVPSAGTRDNNELEVGIAEFLKKSFVDAAALKIRCNIHSYLHSVDKEERDIVIYSDMGVKTELSVSSSLSTFELCDYVMVAGAKKSLSADGRDSLKASYESYLSMGRRPILFSTDTGQGRCFIGMMILREGADASLPKAISSVRKSGMKIISFSNCIGRKDAPEIPDMLRQGSRVYAHDLAIQGRDITHSFGSYDEYCGFSEQDVVTLAKYVKDQNKGLAIFSFTDYAKDAVEYADVFISCAPVRTGVLDISRRK
ncbi:MAG: cation-transporting P-type ATPase [Clostridia bacterium]|nr:cation-transporting P-type ATPase [Clostridia bacterium]